MTCHAKWETVHIAALIPSAFSAAGSIFIIVTGIKYHVQLRKLTFGAQLPIFISICDLGFELSHGGDHLHNVIADYVSEGWLCQLFGSMKPFLINCQTAWALGVALYLNRCIFNGTMVEPTFGPKNVYLHLCCWGIPLIALIFGFAYDVYGVEGPWCGVPDHLVDLLMVDMWIALALIILLVNYCCIAYKLLSVYGRVDSHGYSHAAESQRKVHSIITTIGLYPVAYFIQWLAYALFKTHAIEQTYGAVLWVVTTANLGGIFNLCLYGPLLFRQVKRGLRKQATLKSMSNSMELGKQKSGVSSNTTSPTSTASIASTTSDEPVRGHVAQQDTLASISLCTIVVDEADIEAVP
eukprot:CAMPEP_0197072090 /NCGR_PEP_ID=MMETSP1384-20130603/209923_1 /TAXON_ID=29189 /ORGANISM="Ammonia sp." /LENGTH=351 /DNA_ID=CAMNT_0042510905 /DNA_START=155 /DNA_END=1210 /DNA_ORIENTATION=-